MVDFSCVLLCCFGLIIAREVNAQPGFNADDYYKTYNGLYNDFSYHANSELSHEPKFVVRLAKHYGYSAKTAQSTKAVVLGCSHGKGALMLSQSGFFVSGIDIAEKAVKMANELRGRTCGPGTNPCFVQGSLLSLPYANQSFEVAMSVDVLEHIAPKDVPTVVAEFNRVVRNTLMLNPATAVEIAKNGEKMGVGNLHLTVQSISWWAQQFAPYGWDVVRGSPGLLLQRRGTGSNLPVRSQQAIPKAKPMQNFTAEDYFQTYNALYNNFGYHADSELSHEPKFVLRLAKYYGYTQNTAQATRAVVLGCSHGKGSLLLSKLGFYVSGIDIAEKAVRMANELRGRTCGPGTLPCFVQGTLLKLPYPDNSFEAGMSVDVLEHIAPQDVTAVVAEFSRVVSNTLMLNPATQVELSKTGEKIGIKNVHLTVENLDWWAKQFAPFGWEVVPGTPGLLLHRRTRLV